MYALKSTEMLKNNDEVDLAKLKSNPLNNDFLNFFSAVL